MLHKIDVPQNRSPKRAAFLHQVHFWIFSPIFQHLRIRPNRLCSRGKRSNLRKLVDAVEVGESVGDTVLHGDLTGTDPDTGVVEPDWKVMLANDFQNYVK